MMARPLVLAATVVIMIMPISLLAEEFECVNCYTGYRTLLHGESQLPSVNNIKARGILRNVKNGEFLSNVTYYLECIYIGLGTTNDGNCAIIIMDEDGDMIIGTIKYIGTSWTGNFSYGSGKYRDIKGNYEFLPYNGDTDKIRADLTSHLEENSPLGEHIAMYYEKCSLMKGSFEIK